MRTYVAFSTLLLLASPLLFATPHAAYAQRPNSTVRAASGQDGEAFVNSLLGKMTLEEKIGQMSQVALNTKLDTPADEMARKGQVGSFLFITDAAEINRLQHVAVDQSRLHIPLLFGFDVIHGFRTI